MDILDVIRSEHRAVAALLDEAADCEPGDSRLVELVREISESLAMHLQIEERLFYSKLRERAEDDEELVDVYEAYTEHNVASHLIALLKSGRKPDEKFKAEVQVLGESVKHHVQEEESKVFAIAREAMDPEERDDLGNKWQKAKQRLEGSSAKPGARSPSRKKAAKKTAKKSSATRKRR